MGAPGDPTNDATALWPEENQNIVERGNIAGTALATSTMCDGKTDDPVINLPEGASGLASDQPFGIRSPAYAPSRLRNAHSCPR